MARSAQVLVIALLVVALFVNFNNATFLKSFQKSKLKSSGASSGVGLGGYQQPLIGQYYSAQPYYGNYLYPSYGVAPWYMNSYGYNSGYNNAYNSMLVGNRILI